MPRKTTTAEKPAEKAPAEAPSIGPVPPSTLEAAAAPAAAPAATPPTAGFTELQDRLDMVLLYLHKMDRRDKWRTRGGFLRGLLSLVPVLIAVWAAWYFYMYGDILMKKLTTEVVRQSAAYSASTMDDRIEQLAPLFENIGIPMEPSAEQTPPDSLPADDEPPAEILLPEE